MPKRPDTARMRAAVAAGDPPASAEYFLDDEWHAEQEQWLAKWSPRVLAKRFPGAALAEHKLVARRRVSDRFMRIERVRTVCYSMITFASRVCASRCWIVMYPVFSCGSVQRTDSKCHTCVIAGTPDHVPDCILSCEHEYSFVNVPGIS